MISQTYLAVIVTVLGAILPKLGVSIGSEELTTTVSVLVTLGGAICILVRRYKAGNINILGLRK